MDEWPGGADESGPEWCPFFSDPQYRRFLELVGDELAGRGMACRFQGGVVVASKDGEDHEFGLQNLAQACYHAPPAAWPEVVTHHFEATLDAFEARRRLETEAEDLENVRGLLRPRLYPLDMGPSPFQESCIVEQVAEDLVAVLVFDLPTSTVSVARAYLDTWDVPAEELFVTATENLAADEDLAPSRQRMELHGGGHVDVMGETFYAASHLLLLERYLDGPCPDGVLVAVPHRHALLLHVLEDARVIPTIQSLIPIVGSMWQEGPGSITPSLYWWREGRVERLPVEVAEQSIRFAPPPEFVEVLDRYAGDGEEGEGPQLTLEGPAEGSRLD